TSAFSRAFSQRRGGGQQQWQRSRNRPCSDVRQSPFTWDLSHAGPERSAGPDSELWNGCHPPPRLRFPLRPDPWFAQRQRAPLKPLIGAARRRHRRRAPVPAGGCCCSSPPSPPLARPSVPPVPFAHRSASHPPPSPWLLHRPAPCAHEHNRDPLSSL